MSQRSIRSLNSNPRYGSFILRMTWDPTRDCWYILLKSTNGAEAKLFVDLESLLLYLEATLQK